MTLTETAKRISTHLKRFEADPAINAVRANSQSRPYYGAGAIRLGRFVNVQYITYQGRTNLSRQRAEEYLAWLDDGNEGRHFEAERAT